MKNITIGVFEAKTHLSAILEQVQAGRVYTISKHGKPIAELVPIIEPPKRARRGTASSDEFFMATDFDEPLSNFTEHM